MGKKLFATYDQEISIEHLKTRKRDGVITYIHTFSIKINSQFYKEMKVVGFSKTWFMSMNNLKEETRKEIIYTILKYNRGFENYRPKLLALLKEVDYD